VRPGIYFYILIFILSVQALYAEDRQVIASINTSYHSFHTLDVESRIFVEEEEGLLLDHVNGDVYVHVKLLDESGKSGATSDIDIDFFVDTNFPSIPENWVKRFNRKIRDGAVDHVGPTRRRFEREEYIRIPGTVFDFSRPLNKVKLEMKARTAVKHGWTTRNHAVSRVFYVSPRPLFQRKPINTKSILKMNAWAHSRSAMLEVLFDLFRLMMDPAYKIKEGIQPLNLMSEYRRFQMAYMNKYFGEIDFKAYLAEFVISFSRGIDEKLEFPVEWGSFLNVPDKDFDLHGALPAANEMMTNFENTLANNRHFVALVRQMGEELGLLPKLHSLREYSQEELERLAVFMSVDTRNEYIERINLLRKTELKKKGAYEAIGVDLKRMLGWNYQVKNWLPLERSPVFEMAGRLAFRDDGRREFVEPAVLEAVRGLFFSLFFVLAAEEYYSRVTIELAETAAAVFQHAPPQVTFSLDNQILFNGDDGILVARVYNPSRYVSLNNVHLLMEKKNLRRMIFYRGDNLQTIERLKPQEVRYVFFRFSCIGVGTDTPVMKVRYNQDFETEVRVIPVNVQRKDEFLSRKMEKLADVSEQDVYNSFSRLRDKLLQFQDDYNPPRRVEMENVPVNTGLINRFNR
jgi:hypothetical protein